MLHPGRHGLIKAILLSNAPLPLMPISSVLGILPPCPWESAQTRIRGCYEWLLTPPEMGASLKDACFPRGVTQSEPSACQPRGLSGPGAENLGPGPLS